MPSDPFPEDGALLGHLAIELSWVCSDPDGDPLIYDIYLGTNSPPAVYDSLIDTTTYTSMRLRYNATYYWQVVATDSTGLETAGPVWSFSIGNDVTLPEITVTSPAGGELWYIDNIYNVAWDASDDDSVAMYKIERSPDNGATWLDIQDWTDGNPGELAWAIPTTATTLHLVRVSCRDAGGNVASDVSDGLFTTWSQGGIIAFSSNRDGNYDIFTMFADGSNPVKLTNNSSGDYHPAWSPDCTKMAFMTDRDGNQEIYLMNSDGTEPFNISNNPFDDQLPVWSPDGQKIAFSSNRSGNWDIYVMNIDGSGQSNITNNSAEDYYCSWNPTGQQLAFHSNRGNNWDVYLMDDDGANLMRITTHTAVDAYPAWSPNGLFIAFRSSLPGNNDIYIMDIDGSDQHNISSDSGDDQWPQWSPDGEKIVFYSNRTGEYEIYIINSDGTNLLNLTNDVGSAAVNCAWSPIY
jgi:Tol biopolymer transport system component